jgi:SAM-dependent methyltransferase
MLDIRTKDYWNDRYSTGGNSGDGSYGHLAVFKAEILNGFIAAHGVRTMAELGCGDGHQLGLIEAESYTGYDISPKAVELCSQRYRDDPSRSFKTYDPSGPLAETAPPADLAVSLDVVYHLLEDETYETYMRDLFGLSGRFVAIYSNNTEKRFALASHIRPHRFTDWVDRNLPDWTLCGYVPNRYPYRPGSPSGTSIADFHFFSRNERISPRYSCLFIPPDEAGAGLPDTEAARLMITARECLDTRELEKAAECLRLAAANPHVRPNAINCLGAVLGALGRHREAEEAIKAVLARDSTDRQARLNLTKLYLRLERWDELCPFRQELMEFRITDANVAAMWPLIAVKVPGLR